MEAHNYFYKSRPEIYTYYGYILVSKGFFICNNSEVTGLLKCDTVSLTEWFP